MRAQFTPSAHEQEAGEELCRLRSQDPDEVVPHGPLDGSGYAVCYHSPRWFLAAVEIRDHEYIHRAMGETR